MEAIHHCSAKNGGLGVSVAFGGGALFMGCLTVKMGALCRIIAHNPFFVVLSNSHLRFTTYFLTSAQLLVHFCLPQMIATALQACRWLLNLSRGCRGSILEDNWV